MTRYRLLLAGAVACAFLSAISLGAGLLGIAPILKAILNEHVELPDLARRFNESAPAPLRLPDTWIAALPTGEFTAVAWVFGALAVLTVFGGVANFLHQYLSLTIVQRTVANVRRDAFHRVIRLPLASVLRGGSSDTVSRVVADTAQLESGLSALLSKSVSQVLKGVASFAAALLLAPVLTLIASLIAPVLYTIIRRLGKRIRRASRSALASQAGLYGAASRAMQGLRVVKVHTTERLEAGRFHRYNKEVMRQMLRVRTARALASPLVEVLSILVLGVLSMAASWAILKGKLEPTSFLSSMVCLFAAGASLKPLTGLMNDMQQAEGAAGRLDELLRAEPEPGHDPSLPRLARHAVSIEFRDVTLTYAGAATPALTGINLLVRHGERVAIVGPNGCGKTTLLSLVPRLFDPSGGSVRIDGRDVREVSVRSLRRQIGVVTQETVLFPGTIRDNIAYGADDADAGHVADAARRARAEGFILALPRGYETAVAEQGATLSGGQRQRLAIARAILRDPAILILDEATSMIDADSEARIGEAIAEFTRGRTCLIVAHRLSTVLSADRIVVMDAGRIVDSGSHADLMERCPTYQLIARRQLLGGDGHE
ncbi:MAG: ABC transporter ATP-binding protein [Phycisphaerales bacterium]|nr:ABC transporter ATP-binding protein [Phycisphaerales bacterium]